MLAERRLQEVGGTGHGMPAKGGGYEGSDAHRMGGRSEWWIRAERAIYALELII